MTLIVSAEDVALFFESYRLAFERYDAGAIAEHYAFPCHVTGDAREPVILAIANEAEWLEQIGRLLERYRAIDFRGARILGLTVLEMSAGLRLVTVRWGLESATGLRLYEFQAAYTLVRIAGGLRITAIAHDEVPHYRECAARLGVAKS